MQQHLIQIEQEIARGPYTDTWESLCTHPTPLWYRMAKFGIFIHWGVYSVPAFGDEWYARNIYRQGSAENTHHLQIYGPLETFGYKDFIPLFTAERFSADNWAELFHDAGAQFVMPVAEHHDGFMMYDSALSRWNVKSMGPRRDILGELREAVESRGMELGVSSHRAEHWWFYNCGMQVSSDVKAGAAPDFYGPAAGVTLDYTSLYDNPPDEAFLQEWLVRSCDLVERYHPKVMFFDWWIQVTAFKPWLRKFAAYYYNRAARWGIDVAINGKFDAFAYGSVVPDIERGQLSGTSSMTWQNDTSIAKNSWGYTKNNDFKDARDIICDLVDIVSKNGILLLNVGPRSDGTVCAEEEKVLREIGAWLRVNGEAVYGTVPWRIFGEGPTEIPQGHFTDTQRQPFGEKDIRFTAKANYIYATVMSWPRNGQVCIKSLGTGSPHFDAAIRSIRVLGYNLSVRYVRRKELQIDAPINAGPYPVVLKIELE